MMTTKSQWDKIKWSILSRLGVDHKSYGTPQTYLPFNQTTYPNPDNPLDTGLHLTTLDESTQEVKALRANESMMPSDTDAIAERERQLDKITYL